MNRLLKGVLISLGVVLGIILGIGLLLMATFYYLFGPTYTKEDLQANYDTHTPAIRDLQAHIQAIVPAGKVVHLELDESATIRIFHLYANGVSSNNWKVKRESAKVDSLLRELGWTQQTLVALQAKLEAADCIGVSNGEPCTIDYQRSGMGIYSYVLFRQPLADSVQAAYNDGCNYIYYKDQVVLQYGGGAIGPQCFEGFRRSTQ